jgi:hypothetical protein
MYSRLAVNRTNACMDYGRWILSSYQASDPTYYIRLIFVMVDLSILVKHFLTLYLLVLDAINGNLGSRSRTNNDIGFLISSVNVLVGLLIY